MESIYDIHKKLTDAIVGADLNAVLSILEAAKRQETLTQVLAQQDKLAVLNCIDDAINLLSATLLQMRVVKKVVDGRYGIR